MVGAQVASVFSHFARMPEMAHGHHRPFLGAHDQVFLHMPQRGIETVGFTRSSGNDQRISPTFTKDAARNGINRHDGEKAARHVPATQSAMDSANLANPRWETA